MRAHVVGSVIGLAAMVVGCGSSQPAAAPAAGGDIASVAFSSAEENRQARTLAAAREQLVRRCMTARGFTLPRTAPAPSVPAADTAPSGAGYGLLAQFDRPALPGPAARTAAYRRALLGSPRQTGTLRLPGAVVVTYRSSGCHADAMGSLYGSVRRYQRIVALRNAVRSAAGERVAGDLLLAGALTGWSRCMKLRGFSYASPTAARMGVYDAYLKTFDRTRARRLELATAAADRYCAERTQIYPELARARGDALRAMPSDERAAAVAIARSQAIALERAHRIVRARR